MSRATPRRVGVGRGVAPALPAAARLRAPAAPRAATRRRSRTEAVGAAGVVALTAVAAAHLLAGGLLVGQDSLTQFYPWYSYLGERLRAGEIPAWNPAQFGGAPFAGDPQSGWMYLPAMLAFALLPVHLAAPVFVVGHVALAAGATYALGRALGEGPLGALVAAAAYAYAGPVLGRAPCCPATYQVAAWTPVAILGFELAVRAGSWRARGAAWGLAGFAVSQVIAAWIGQGAYYALLALGAFALYRTVFAPPRRADGGAPRLPARARALVLHGGAVLLIGFGLAAAGILPRLEYNAESNLAGGRYQGSGAWAAAVSGMSADELDRALDPGLYYAGGAAVALGAVALLLARRSLAVPYAAVLGLGAAILVLPARTPLHSLLYEVLPRFEALHRHWPERVTMVAYLAPALLAGTTVGSLARWRRWPRRLLRAAAVPCLVALGLLALRPATLWPAVAAVLAALLLAAAALLPARAARWAPPLLLLLVAGDLFAMARALAADAPFGGFHRPDLAAYAEPTPAVSFLRQRTRDAPARYFGFDPGLGTVEHGRSTLYRSRFANPAAAALLVNNRATLFGLEDIQGYNPVQPLRFVEFLDALNGTAQEYHDANVLPGGVDSPLLDLLGVRYVLVPTDAPPGHDAAQHLVRTHRIVYADDRVRVLERPGALPRAWLVHEAHSVGEGEALAPLATGAVDPRRVALVEGPVPALAPPPDPAADRARVVVWDPERVRVETRSAAPALLVLGQMTYPAWRATVDGAPTDLLTADHLLLAVAVPAGEHVVELRFESPALRLGTTISLATAAALAAFLTGAAWRERGARPRHSTDVS